MVASQLQLAGADALSHLFPRPRPRIPCYAADSATSATHRNVRSATDRPEDGNLLLASQERSHPRRADSFFLGRTFPATTPVVSTDEQFELLRRIARAGGNLTVRGSGRELINLRLVIDVGRYLQRRKLVRLMATESAAHLELTDAGRQELELFG